MQLKEIAIENFCSCAAIRMPLARFNPIVGYNNSGKSNILRAISWLLRKHVLPAAVFTNPNAAIVVEGLISGVNLNLLPPNQQAQISSYIQNSELRFRRRQDQPGVPVGQIRIEVLDPATGNWVANPTGLDNAIAVLFPQPLHIQAMEDAAEDVSKFAAKNTIGLLLKYAMEQMRANNPTATASLGAALSQVADMLNGANRVQQIQNLETEATQAIAPFFPGISLHLAIQSPELDELVKGATVTLADSAAVARPFTSFGHGAQRSVHMALIKLLASYATAGNGSTVLLLIDEPELYLHPQAIEILRDSLRTLSGQGFQVVFSTHSPLLIPSDHVLETSVVYKVQGQGTTVRPKLANAAQVVAINAHQASVVFALQHSTYLLFAEEVVVVEGKTERMLLPELYTLLRGRSLGYDKKCLIEASSSSSIVPMMQVLRGVGFNPKAVVDLDFAFRHAGALLAGVQGDVQACLSWFSGNTAHGFVLDAAGLPARRNAAGQTSTITPEEAFGLMAVAMAGNVSDISTSLFAQGVWMWTKGAIEQHLGIQKTDQARQTFLLESKNSGGIAHAADPGSVGALLTWL